MGKSPVYWTVLGISLGMFLVGMLGLAFTHVMMGSPEHDGKLILACVDASNPAGFNTTVFRDLEHAYRNTDGSYTVTYNGNTGVYTPNPNSLCRVMPAEANNGES